MLLHVGSEVGQQLHLLAQSGRMVIHRVVQLISVAFHILNSPEDKWDPWILAPCVWIQHSLKDSLEILLSLPQKRVNWMDPVAIGVSSLISERK